MFSKETTIARIAMRSHKRSMLMFALAFLLLPYSASAGKPGIPVTSKNERLIEQFDTDTYCYSSPKLANPISGKVKKIKVKSKNGKKAKKKSFFISNKKQFKDALKKLKDRGVSLVGPKGQKLKSKFQEQIRVGDNLCLLGEEITEVVDGLIGSSGEPTLAIENFLELISGAMSSSDDPVVFTRLVEIRLLRALQDKADFDALYTLSQNAEGFYNMADFLPLLSNSTRADNLCPAQANTSLYRIPGGTNNFITELVSSLLLYIQMSSASTTDITVRHWTNPDALPSSTGEPFCRLFLGPASSPFTEPNDNDAIKKLPNNMQQLAKEYQDAYNRCLTEYGVSAESVQSLQGWISETESYVPSDAAVTGLRSVVAQDVTSGRKIVLLPHGRGNLIAEEALNGLTDDDEGSRKTSVGVVAVATSTPYSQQSSYGAFQYLSLANDIMTQIAGAPASNTSNDLSSNSAITTTTHRFAVHDFGRSYFFFEGTRAQILAAIFAQEAALQNDREGAGQGYFQVTLEWNIAGDIDLHTHEPNGSHVYWADKKGVSGELDRDDIPGTGPENYFVCTRDRMEVGNYVVTVNNFGGTTGTLASITIRAGGRIESFTVTMDSANGGSILLPVATVNYGANGRFTITDDR